MRAAEVMTTQVVTVAPSTPFRELVEVLTGHNIGAVPVVGADAELLGIVSVSDLMLRLQDGGDAQLHPLAGLLRPGRGDVARKVEGLCAQDVMTTDVITADAGTQVADIARLMLASDVRQVIVLQDGKLAGILTRMDVLRSLT